MLQNFAVFRPQSFTHRVHIAQLNPVNKASVRSQRSYLLLPRSTLHFFPSTEWKVEGRGKRESERVNFPVPELLYWLTD